jgi:RHS repeat-associated protein
LYRYAFQGQELDKETGMEAFQLRLWDGRIGRWLSTDPYGQYESPYLGMGNNPISGIDPDGGYVYIVGRNKKLLKLFNDVINTSIGMKALKGFINNPKKHIFITQANLKAVKAGGMTSYMPSSRVNSKNPKYTQALAKDVYKMYYNEYKSFYDSFIGIKLQPGTNYLIAIDIDRYLISEPHYTIVAAFHELYAHIILKEAGVKGGDAQHMVFAGNEGGTMYDIPKENSNILPEQYPIQIFMEQLEKLKKDNIPFTNMSDQYRMQNLLNFSSKKSSSKVKLNETKRCDCHQNH